MKHMICVYMVYVGIWYIYEMKNDTWMWKWMWKKIKCESYQFVSYNSFKAPTHTHTDKIAALRRTLSNWIELNYRKRKSVFMLVELCLSFVDERATYSKCGTHKKKSENKL